MIRFHDKDVCLEGSNDVLLDNWQYSDNIVAPILGPSNAGIKMVQNSLFLILKLQMSEFGNMYASYPTGIYLVTDQL